MACSEKSNSLLSELNVELQKSSTTLVAVSKTKTTDAILELYDSGQRIFGENRVQELIVKHDQLPKDISWHFIGTLQRKKVKLLLPHVSLIHSVDSVSLLEKIEKEASKLNIKVNVLLQFYIATESSKQGFQLDEIQGQILDLIKGLKQVHIIGVMGMASFVSDEAQIRAEFRSLKGIFDSLKSNHFLDQEEFKVISMGMSGDYKIAIEEGANMVRIGSLLFGAR